MSEVETISPKDARLLVAKAEPVTVLDLRDQDEFGEGHLPAARNLPDASSDSLPDDLPEEGKVLVCDDRDGIAEAIAEDGREVLVLEGGFDAWASEKLPSEPSEDPGSSPDTTPKLPGAGT